MADYHYGDNTFVKRSRRRALRSVLVAVFTIILLVVGYIIYDSLSTSTEVTTTPPTVSTLGQQAEQFLYENEHFRLTADASWREAPPLDEGPLNFRFQSFERELVRRDLTVYVNTIPEDLALTHVVPVESDGNKVIPLSTSPKCGEIQPDRANKRDVPMSWAGVSFLCDPDLNAYILGTSHAKSGYGLKLGSNRFFFVYRDLEAAPQLVAFQRALRGFEAK